MTITTAGNLSRFGVAAPSAKPHPGDSSNVTYFGALASGRLVRGRLVLAFENS